MSENTTKKIMESISDLALPLLVFLVLLVVVILAGDYIERKIENYVNREFIIKPESVYEVSIQNQKLLEEIKALVSPEDPFEGPSLVPSLEPMRGKGQGVWQTPPE